MVLFERLSNGSKKGFLLILLILGWNWLVPYWERFNELDTMQVWSKKAHIGSQGASCQNC